jgi:hypothetical protein
MRTTMDIRSRGTYGVGQVAWLRQALEAVDLEEEGTDEDL